MLTRRKLICDCINVRQSRLQNKAYFWGERGTLQSDKGSSQQKDITIINVSAHNNFKMHEAKSDRTE